MKIKTIIDQLIFHQNASIKEKNIVAQKKDSIKFDKMNALQPQITSELITSGQIQKIIEKVQEEVKNLYFSFSQNSRQILLNPEVKKSFDLHYLQKEIGQNLLKESNQYSLIHKETFNNMKKQLF